MARRETIWEWHRRNSPEESRERMRRVMDANANPGRTTGQMVGEMAKAAATKGWSVLGLLPGKPSEFDQMLMVGMGTMGGMRVVGPRVPSRVPLSSARLPGPRVGKATAPRSAPRRITDEELARDRVKLLRDQVLMESAKLQKGPAPATNIFKKPVEVDPTGLEKPSRFDAELKPFVDARKVTSPQAEPAQSPGWPVRAAKWVGRKAIVPFNVFRPSVWKEHPVKNVMTAIADLGLGYVGYGVHETRKAAKEQNKWAKAKTAESVQSAVNESAAAFDEIDPVRIAADVRARDFSSFDRALGVMKGAVWNDTNPDYSFATNRVPVSAVDTMAREMPRGAWYRRVADMYSGQTSRFVTTKEGDRLDMSDEDAVVEYGINDFLERSKFRKKETGK